MSNVNVPMDEFIKIKLSLQDNHGYNYVIMGNRVAIGTRGLLTIYEYVDGFFKVFNRYQCDEEIVPSIVADVEGSSVVVRQSKQVLLDIDLVTKDIKMVAAPDKVTPSNRFGESMCMTEGGVLVVGDPGEHPDSGLVVLYVKRDEVWTHMDTLYPAISYQGGQFGRKVEMSGNKGIVVRSNDSMGRAARSTYMHDGYEWVLHSHIEGLNF